MWNVEASSIELLDMVRRDDERHDLTFENGLQFESEIDRNYFRLCVGHSIMQYYLGKSLAVTPEWAIKVRRSKVAPVALRRFARSVMPSDADKQLEMLLKIKFGAGGYRNAHYPHDNFVANRFATAVECSGADLVSIATRPNEHGLRSLSFTRLVVDTWLKQWKDGISEVYEGSVASRSTVNFLLESTGLKVK